MVFIESSAQIIQCFREIDQPAIPPVEIPRSLIGSELDREHLAWISRSGDSAFILLERAGKLRGLRLARGKRGRSGRAEMCQWCKRVGSGSDMALFSVRMDSRTTAAIALCHDLNCAERIDAQPVPVDAMRETITQQRKHARLRGNIVDFVLRCFRSTAA